MKRAFMVIYVIMTISIGYTYVYYVYNANYGHFHRNGHFGVFRYHAFLMGIMCIYRYGHMSILSYATYQHYKKSGD